MPRQKKKRRTKNKVLLTILNIFIITLILSIVIVSGIIFFMVKDAIAKLPKDTDVSEMDFSQSSQILDSQGNLLTKNLGTNFRTVVKYEDISPHMINAIIAIEDKTFWQHRGFNYVRLLGAIRNAITSGDDISGTSTISQQLARNVFLPETRFERSPTRKIQEAYYAMQLEDKLTKKQIITAYLNMVFLGAHADGVQAASQIYFSKDAKDLDYIEAAMLASVPQAPTMFAPMSVVEKKTFDGSGIVLGSPDTEYLYLYNPSIENRYKLVLEQMKEQGYITEAEYKTGLQANLSDKLKPATLMNTEVGTYFIDMVKKQVVDDLAEKLNISKEAAQENFLTRGYTVHSTLDVEMQKRVEGTIGDGGAANYYGNSVSSQVAQLQRENGLVSDGILGPRTWQVLIDKGYFGPEMKDKVWNIGDEDPAIATLKEALTKEGYIADYSLMPGLTPLFDNGRILNQESNQIAMYNFLDYFDKEKNFYLSKDEFSTNEEGHIVIPANGVIRFSENDKKLIFISLFEMYNFPGNTANNGYYGVNYIPYYLLYQDMLLDLPQEILHINGDGNLVIDKSILSAEKKFSINENGSLVIPKDYVITAKAPVIEPQIAAAIIDQHNGYLRSVIGGRNVVGNMLFNRASTPHQTGSSIKPISVYATAIDTETFTAASVLDDVPTYDFNPHTSSPWPNNYSFSYSGRVSLRRSLQDSINVTAVKTAHAVGLETIISYLKQMGVSSLVLDGDHNDINLAALALGGLTYGISPVEMASAYTTMANEGVHIPYKTYSKVVDAEGNVVLDNSEPKGTQVLRPGTAFIMTDIMKSNVDSWLGTNARIRSNNRGIPVAGKTGTTDSNFDIWFVGYTPYYTAAVWIGSDRPVKLNQFSSRAASIWSEIMTSVHSDLEDKDFPEQPDDVVVANIDGSSGKLPGKFSYLDPRGSQVRSEYFLVNTVPTEVDNTRFSLKICKVSGKLAGEFCPAEDVEERIFLTDIKDGGSYWSGSAGGIDYGTPPTDTCDVHTSPPTPTEPSPTEPPKPETNADSPPTVTPRP